MVHETVCVTHLDCTCSFDKRLYIEGLLYARHMLVHKTEVCVLFVGRKQVNEGQ